MRATEFIIDNVEEKLKNVPTKPRNFVAKNAMKTTSGAGAHRDKKKEQKQGDFKHKNQGVAEVTGDQPFDSMMKKVTKAPTAKERNAERIRQKGERQADSRKRSADVFGANPADKLSIRKAPGVAEVRAGVDDTDTVGFSVNSEAAYNAVMKRFGDYIDHDETSGIMYAPAKVWPRIEMVAFDADGEGATKDEGVEEGSKENDPFEQGWRTFFRRGDESDNPYEKGSPEYAQWLNGFQEGEAQPNHYESVAVAEKAPPGDKAERMVKHIKKGYAKDGKLTDKERSIAYATAWKHHNK